MKWIVTRKVEDGKTLDEVNAKLIEELDAAHADLKAQNEKVQKWNDKEFSREPGSDDDDIVMTLQELDADYYKSTLQGVESTTKLINERDDSRRRIFGSVAGSVIGGFITMVALAFLDHCEKRGEEDVATQPSRHPGFKFIKGPKI